MLAELIVPGIYEANFIKISLQVGLSRNTFMERQPRCSHLPALLNCVTHTSNSVRHTAVIIQKLEN
jgi:ABC-type antimicrobial peptide transport system permease subunit